MDIIKQVKLLESYIKSVEDFLTIHQQFRAGTYTNAVKVKSKQVDFIERSGHIRNIIMKHVKFREMVKAFFYQSDRAARLM